MLWTACLAKRRPDEDPFLPAGRTMGLLLTPAGARAQEVYSQTDIARARGVQMNFGIRSQPLVATPPANLTTRDLRPIYSLNDTENGQRVLTKIPKKIACPRFDPKARPGRARAKDRYQRARGRTPAGQRTGSAGSSHRRRWDSREEAAQGHSNVGQNGGRRAPTMGPVVPLQAGEDR